MSLKPQSICMQATDIHMSHLDATAHVHGQQKVLKLLVWAWLALLQQHAPAFATDLGASVLRTTTFDLLPHLQPSPGAGSVSHCRANQPRKLPAAAAV